MAATPKQPPMYAMSPAYRPSSSTNPPLPPNRGLSEEFGCTFVRAVEMGVLSTFPKPRVNIRKPYNDIEIHGSFSTEYVVSKRASQADIMSHDTH